MRKLSTTITEKDGLTRVRLHKQHPNGDVETIRDFTGKIHARSDGNSGMSQIVLLHKGQSETFHVPTGQLS